MSPSGQEPSARLPSSGDVAIIIAAKDAAATLERAVRSALRQPEASEVIVVDDGSTDGTAEVARQLDEGDGRLKVVSQPPSGPAAARNLALSLSRAAWVTPLDADDFLLPGRLSKLLAQAGDCDFIADDLLVVNQGEEDSEPRRLVGDRLQAPFWLDFFTFVDSNISRPGLERRELGFLKPMMRRAFLDEAAVSYDPRLRLGEDFILYATALAKRARFKIIEACGYVSVQRPNSLSHRHTVADLKALQRASDRLAALPGLSSKEVSAARRHHRHVTLKVDFREVLEAKQTGGMLGAMAAAAMRPASAPYILRQKLASVAQRA